MSTLKKLWEAYKFGRDVTIDESKLNRKIVSCRYDDELLLDDLITNHMRTAKITSTMTTTEYAAYVIGLVLPYTGQISLKE